MPAHNSSPAAQLVLVARQTAPATPPAPPRTLVLVGQRLRQQRYQLVNADGAAGGQAYLLQHRGPVAPALVPCLEEMGVQ